MEIERKFIVDKLPDVIGTGIEYERHFIYLNKDIEIRIQRKGNKFELERKEKIDDLKSKKDKMEITKEEFDALSQNSIKSLERTSYIKDGVSYKVYEGIYSGLIRAEVEFETEEEAKLYSPLESFGKEITNSKVGKDSRLIKLSKEEFKSILEGLS